MANQAEKKRLEYDSPDDPKQRRCYAIVAVSIDAGEVHIAFRTDGPDGVDATTIVHRLTPASPVHNLQNTAAGGALVFPLPNKKQFTAALSAVFVNTTEVRAEAACLNVVVCDFHGQFAGDTVSLQQAVAAKSSFPCFVTFFARS